VLGTMMGFSRLRRRAARARPTLKTPVTEERDDTERSEDPTPSGLMRHQRGDGAQHRIQHLVHDRRRRAGADGVAT
jgi:hypothetical protein